MRWQRCLLELDARAADRDELLRRADAALASSRQLLGELLDQIAAAKAEGRRAEQTKLFQSELSAPLSISLLVRLNRRPGSVGGLPL